MTTDDVEQRIYN